MIGQISTAYGQQRRFSYGCGSGHIFNSMLRSIGRPARSAPPCEFIVRTGSPERKWCRRHTWRLPVGYADFPKEVAVPPFSWITQTYNLVPKTSMPHIGHFAALEQPDLLVADIRKFFAKIDQRSKAGNCSLIRNACETDWPSKSRCQVYMSAKKILDCFCGCGLSCTSCRH